MHPKLLMSNGSSDRGVRHRIIEKSGMRHFSVISVTLT